MSIVFNGLTTIPMRNQCPSSITSHYYTNDKAMSDVYNGLTAIPMIMQCLSYLTDSLLYQ